MLKKNGLELAVLDTLDMGKTLNDTYTSDVPGSIKNVRWYGEIIDKVYDDIAPTPYNSLALITKEPIGVVAANRSLELSINDGCLESWSSTSYWK